MDDVDDDLFPHRTPPAADVTLSADGLEGFFDREPDASLAVDTVGELFDSPDLDRLDPGPTPAAVATAAVAEESPSEDLMGRVEDLFDNPAEPEPVVAPIAVAEPDAPVLEIADADPDMPVGDLVANLADDLRRLEIALRAGEDDSD